MLDYLVPLLSQLPIENTTADGLKSLLLSISTDSNRDSRSKAVEELQNELERLVTTLRNTENSVAFHKPVRKSDAPDYYNIISHPMDFQTLSKKIKAKAYSSKAGFKRDLDKIWSNCLLYNSDPLHPLRKIALDLQTQANKILAGIVDPGAQKPKESVDPLGNMVICLGSRKMPRRRVERRTTGPGPVVDPERIVPDVGTSSFGQQKALVRTADKMRAFQSVQLKMSRRSMRKWYASMRESALMAGIPDGVYYSGETSRKYTSGSKIPRSHVLEGIKMLKKIDIHGDMDLSRSMNCILAFNGFDAASREAKFVLEDLFKQHLYNISIEWRRLAETKRSSPLNILQKVLPLGLDALTAWIDGMPKQSIERMNQIRADEASLNPILPRPKEEPLDLVDMLE